MLGNIISKFDAEAKSHMERQSLNPFSGSFSRSPSPRLSKDQYGKPVAGSKTEERGNRAKCHILREIQDLCNCIHDLGIYNKSHRPSEDSDDEQTNDEEIIVSFGEIFQIYTKINDKVVGLLIAAKKRGFIFFEKEILFQRRDDDVLIALIKPISEVRAIINKEIAGQSSPVPFQSREVSPAVADDSEQNKSTCSHPPSPLATGISKSPSGNTVEQTTTLAATSHSSETIKEPEITKTPATPTPSELYAASSNSDDSRKCSVGDASSINGKSVVVVQNGEIPLTEEHQIPRVEVTDVEQSIGSSSPAPGQTTENIEEIHNELTNEIPAAGPDEVATNISPDSTPRETMEIVSEQTTLSEPGNKTPEAHAERTTISESGTKTPDVQLEQNNVCELNNTSSNVEIVFQETSSESDNQTPKIDVIPRETAMCESNVQIPIEEELEPTQNINSNTPTHENKSDVPTVSEIEEDKPKHIIQNLELTDNEVVKNKSQFDIGTPSHSEGETGDNNYSCTDLINSLSAIHDRGSSPDLCDEEVQQILESQTSFSIHSTIQDGQNNNASSSSA